MKSAIYRQAEYYELAFSFINAKKQADLFERFINKYSKIEVKTIVDIACGTALQLREMSKRSYKCIGLDDSAEMLEYVKVISEKENLEIGTVKADMNNFKINNKVDFAYIMMGSIIYTETNKGFLSHLNSVAGSLKSGGLYLIENFPINWTSPKFFKQQSWTMKKGRVKVRTVYQIIPKETLRQTVNQIIKLEVVDNDKKFNFVDKNALKIIMPEELKLLVEKNGKFEFMGFFERNNMKQLRQASSDNIILLRKKHC